MRSLHESETIESSVACSVRVSTDHEPHRAALVPNPMGPSCPGRACQLLTVCDRLLLIAIRNRQRAAKQRRLRAVPPSTIRCALCLPPPFGAARAHAQLAPSLRAIAFCGVQASPTLCWTDKGFMG